MSRDTFLPIAAVAIWWLVVKGTYQRVERVFLAMSLVFLGYVVQLSRASALGHRCSRNRATAFRLHAGISFSFVAVIGTTISPYMQVFIQSSVVEKGVRAENTALRR